MISFTSSALPCTFQVHHRIRNLRRSEMEADIDTQEDGVNLEQAGADREPYFGWEVVNPRPCE